MTRTERFFTHVEVTDTCWLWTGATAKGYGRVGVDGRTHQAHRWLWNELGFSTIPSGWHLDHLCRVRRCVNPLHLESVTHWENLVRGPTIARRVLNTECLHGHPFDSANTHFRKDGTRSCRRCHSDRERARRLRVLA